jgi:hypothetical protein
MRLLYGDMPPRGFDRPEGLLSVEVCGISGMRPGPKCSHRVHELFIAGTEPVDTCSFHQHEEFYHELPAGYAGWLYERDKRNATGSFRLAGFPHDLGAVFDRPSSMDSVMDNIQTVRVLYPKIKQSQPAAGLSKDEDYNRQPDSAKEKAPVRIAYPLSHDHFIINEAAESTIKLEGVAATPIPYIDWFIDGMHKGRTGPPYRLSWDIERGRHRIMAVGPDHRGDSIEITVE